MGAAGLAMTAGQALPAEEGTAVERGRGVPGTLPGVVGDGKTDDTAALQKALDAAGVKGGRVELPPGRYLVAGSLRIPPGVLLQGAAESPQWTEPLVGSIVLATGGRGKEDGPALFEMGHSSAVRGVIVYYPEQKPSDIQAYPWTFHMVGHDGTVENVTLINSYNGISVGPEGNVRHRIRSVVGCVLRRGLVVDSTTDIGRVENVQWHCHWWSAPSVGGDWAPVHKFMVDHLEAFIFGRTDWEYVTNTFVYPCNIGYRFLRTKSGAMNGQLCGIGADEAQVCVKVEEIQDMGLLITNGQFVVMHGEPRVQVVVDPSCTGSVRLVNCAFWGPSKQNVVSHGKGYLSLSDCYLSSQGRKTNGDKALVEVDAGRLQVRGCSFATDEVSLRLGKGLKHAIISENNGTRGVEVANDAGDAVILLANEPPAGA
jgi:hypothetical protein